MTEVSQHIAVLYGRGIVVPEKEGTDGQHYRNVGTVRSSRAAVELVERRAVKMATKESYGLLASYWRPL